MKTSLYYDLEKGMEVGVELTPRPEVRFRAPNAIPLYNPRSGENYILGAQLIEDLILYLRLEENDYTDMFKAGKHHLFIPVADPVRAKGRISQITFFLEDRRFCDKQKADYASEYFDAFLTMPEVDFIFFNHDAVQKLSWLADGKNPTGYGYRFEALITKLAQQGDVRGVEEVLYEAQSNSSRIGVFPGLGEKRECRSYLGAVRDYQRSREADNILSETEKFAIYHQEKLNALYRMLLREGMPQQFVEEFTRELAKAKPKTPEDVNLVVQWLGNSQETQTKYAGVLDSRSFKEYHQAIRDFRPDRSQTYQGRY